MIGTRTPFRISFVGGGSDLRSFYRNSPGAVVSTSINRYMYIFIHQLFANHIQLKYSKTELVKSIKDIVHPIFKAALSKFKLSGIDINSIADIPAGTGLGSSSSFTVGLLHALYSYSNRFVSAEELAQEACNIEIDILREPIGKQDQYAAAYGGLNHIIFYSNEEVFVEKIVMNPQKYEELQGNLLMFYTGESRDASSILSSQNKNISENIGTVNTIKDMVFLANELKKSLMGSNIDAVGEIMHDNWQLKKKLSKKISKEYIDVIYDKALKNGATGGKLLGAGGGGFLLFYCPRDNHEKLRFALSEYQELKFNFDNSGSRLIYVGDNQKEL